MDKRIIAEVMHCKEDDIVFLTNSLGMTNSTQIAEISGKRYVIREPGVGSNKLVDRDNECEAYSLILDKGLSDNLIYYNKDTGLKITEFVENSHNADINNEEDVRRIIAKLKEFHALKLKSKHRFNIFSKTLEYKKLMGNKSKYDDYDDVERDIRDLSGYILDLHVDEHFTHIDPNVDNFLLTDDKVYLIDWEYAGMQDQHVDIAMMCIYSMLDKEHIDTIIDIYFDGQCDELTRYKIYAYCAMCGLLWSNWCEYKEQLGESYPVYDAAQYMYAKAYSKLALEYFERNLK